MKQIESKSAIYANLLKLAEDFCLMAEAEHIYGPYTRPDNRSVIIIKNDDGTQKTMSYPKYLLLKHLNMDLDSDLTVDHLDYNRQNNDLNNLRLVPRDTHSGDDTRRVRLIKLQCPVCQKEFERSPRLIRDKSKKGKVSTFCSRECAGRYSRQVQLGLIDRLPVQDAPVSEYYRRKIEDGAVQAVSKYLFEKYAFIL